MDVTPNLELLDLSLHLLITSVTQTAQLSLAFVLLAYLIKKNNVIYSAKACSTETLRNLSLMTINTAVTVPLILFASEYIDDYKFTNYSMLLTIYLPDFAVLIFAIFLGDLIGYWRHRIEHTRFIWPSHAVHHSDTQMTWLTLERFHPINRITTYVIDNSFLLLIGLPPEAVITNNLVRHYYGYFIHAGTPWTYGTFWGKLFVSPAMHQWHHATAASMHNKNFATVFACIDYVFGTYSVPGPCKSKLGVSYNYKMGILDQLANPFRLNSYKKHVHNEESTAQK